MAEYIEREALISICEQIISDDWNKRTAPESWADAYECFMEDVQDQPAADVVEVVRCKDCAIPHNRFTGCPKLNGLIPPENHYCGFGERKEGDDK